MKARDFLKAVIRPTLQGLGMGGLSAEWLVLGTAAQESQFHYLRQLGGGPGLGFFQVEPATHRDIWDSYLVFRPDLANAIENLTVPYAARVDQLIWNLRYAVAICRVHYRRVPAPLPTSGDLPAMAAYWKRYYNTSLGRGKEDEFIENFEKYCLEAFS